MSSWKQPAGKNGESAAGRLVAAAAAAAASMLSTTVVLDLGAAEWRCGFADDDGPEYVQAGVPLGVIAWEAALLDMLDELEVSEAPSEHALLLSEPPGTSESARMEVARVLFERVGIGSLLTVAAPLLALYSSSMDTGVLVDVGSRATSVLMIVDGRPVLDAATLLPHDSAGDVDTDVSGHTLDGRVAQTILRCLALADVSLRGALLGRIVLVGGGTMTPGFTERVSRDIEEALRASRAPWTPNVIANAERRLSCWLGGATVALLASARARFVSSDAYQRDAAAVHACALPLACRPLAAQEAAQRALAASEASAVAQLAARARRHATAAAEEARAWWVSQAPPRGEVERSRQRAMQQLVVRPLYERALRVHVLRLPASAGGDTPSTVRSWDGRGSRAHRAESSARGPGANLVQGSSMPKQASAANGGDVGGRSHATRDFLPAAAALELAATAMRLLHTRWVRRRALPPTPSLYGVGDGDGDDSASVDGSRGDDDGGDDDDRDVAVCGRVMQLLAARWASSPMNAVTSEDAARAAAHHHRGKRLLGWARLRAHAQSCAHLRARGMAARRAWQQLAQHAVVATWAARRRLAEAGACRMATAASVHTTALVRTWSARALELQAHGTRLRQMHRLGVASRLRRDWAQWHGAATKRSRLKRLVQASLVVPRRAMGLWVRVAARSQVCLRMRRAAACHAARVHLGQSVARWRRQMQRYVRGLRPRVYAEMHACSKLYVRFWRRLRATDGWHTRRVHHVAARHHARAVWARVHSHLLRSGRHQLQASLLSRLAPTAAARLARRRLHHTTRTWARLGLQRSAGRTVGELVVRHRLSHTLACLAENAHRLRVMRRVKLRRVAGRLRRGLRESRTATLRRGMAGLERHRHEEATRRRGKAMLMVRGPYRELLDLILAVERWSEQAARWRQRQKWMRRQVRYMRELQNVIDTDGDGKQWARQLRRVGVEPHVLSEEGAHPTHQGDAMLARALQREFKVERSPSATMSMAESPVPSMPARKFLVLSPGLDSYLDDVL